MSNEFRNLVFEGGGVKGIAYGGALLELENMGILTSIKRVAGTSAGAITAALLSVGYSSSEISTIISETNFKSFEDDNPGVLWDIKRMLTEYGWFKGDKFKRWIGKYIKKKTGKIGLTFGELHKLARRKKFLDLYVIGTNLSEQAVEIYSCEDTPDMRIDKAVRISMSIPLYFRSIKRGKNVLVDGGVVRNYPINLFDRKHYLHNPKNGEVIDYNKTRGFVFNHETLGFRLDSKDEILYNKKGWSNVPKKIDKLSDFALALLGFMMESANKSHLHKNDWKRTVFIDTLGIKATDFDLDKDKIDALIKSGREGVEKHFEWRNGSEGMDRPK